MSILQQRWDMSDGCYECFVHYRPALLNAFALTALRAKRKPEEIARAYLAEYHANGHRRVGQS